MGLGVVSDPVSDLSPKTYWFTKFDFGGVCTLVGRRLLSGVNRHMSCVSQEKSCPHNTECSDWVPLQKRKTLFLVRSNFQASSFIVMLKADEQYHN